jgi:hypothetical protein
MIKGPSWTCPEKVERHRLFNSSTRRSEISRIETGTETGFPIKPSGMTIKDFLSPCLMT